MNLRWDDTFQDGVARPAAFSSRARNQSGIGLEVFFSDFHGFGCRRETYCVCVSTLFEVEKSNSCMSTTLLARAAILAIASLAKGSTVKSMPST